MRTRAFLGVVVLLAFVSFFACSEDAPSILVFYEEGCPSCLEMEEFLSVMAWDLPESAIRRYEISEPGTLKLLASLEAEYGIEITTVPIIFVGDVVVMGSGRDQELVLGDAISRCQIYGCSSPLDRVLTPDSIRADLRRLALLLGVFLLLLLWQTS